MKEDEDWTFLDDGRIWIKTGSYANVVYRYNKVKVYEKKIKGETKGVLEFDFDVDDFSGDHSFEKEELESNENFQQTIGDILCTLLASDEIRIGEEKTNG